MTKYLLLGVFAATFALAQQDADIPPKFQDKIDEEVYQRLRSEYLDLLRGLPADPRLRATAIQKMQKQIQTMKQRAIVGSSALNAPAAVTASAVWTAIGPSPIPNGQVTNSLPVTGRVTAFAIDPTNSKVVYLGTAQGGIYRSTDGGLHWMQIFDQANTSAIGSLALAPSNHTILFVGTGEANGSGDSYAGVGLYRIDNADTTATLVGPINPIRNYTDGSGNPQSVPAFQGRSISSIVVHPTDPSILWVGAVSGVIDIGADPPFGGTIPPLGMRGLYRLTNATAAPASVAVQKITVTLAAPGFDLPNTGNRNVDSIAIEPGNPDSMIVWVNGTTAAGDGGIYRSINATSPVPAFAQVLATTTSPSRGILSIYKQGTNPAVVYVANAEGSSGRLRVSTDGGATWSAFLAGGRGFCGGQCFYNIGIDVLPGPTTAASDDIIVIGGNTPGTTSRLFAKSIDGGATFTESSAGLHADTHFIKIDPTNSATIYHGDDGGIFKSTDGGLTWSSLNNMQINTVQFSGLAVHPTDPKWSIGGTQDNGTNMRDASGNWRRVDFGDGGYALVDRNATDTTNQTLYHTYFNQTNNLIGFARVLSTACASDGLWSFKGIYSGGAVDPTPNCDSSDTFNGIPLTDAVMFYAPMEMGPGNPSTVYFGAGALYRSTDKGETMPAVSQRTTVPVSTIAVSPQDDNYRIFGRANGTVFYTTTGANPMTQLLGIPIRYIARAKFDSSDKETAYVTLGGYFGGTAAAQSHVWKITNLSTAPAVSGINGGLPDVPVNAFAVDPANGTNLFAGTDIGVYNSTDGGLTWLPYGTGLPVVAVFGMEIQAQSRTLRIATHGRGMWEIPLGPAAPNAATFLPLDSSTQGNWPGVYGGDGYIIANNTSNQTPSYATVNFTGASSYTWVSPAPSSDQRLPHTSPGSSNRIGSAFYSASNFSIDLTLTGGQHQVALYLLDLDTTTRSEVITIRNADDNSVLDTRTFSNFHNGLWAVWTMRGHVNIQVANNGGPNGVVAGLFFSTLTSPHSRPVVTIYSPTPNQTVTGTITLSANVTASAGVQSVQFVLDNTTNLSPLIPGDGATYTYQWNSATVGNGPHTLQVTGTDNLSETGQSSVTFNVSNAAAPPASAQFIAPADTTTQGNWVGKYGNDGFWIANDLSSAPPVYANLNFTGTSAYTWNGSTSEKRALLTSPTGSPSARIASTYYSNTSFTIDLNLNDNQPHLVALYLLDYDDNRAESITVVDANNTSNVLDTQSAANFQNGEYLVWKIQGHVQIQVKATGGLNGVVSGIFFAPASSGGQQQPPAVTVTAPTPNQAVSGIFKLQATATSTGSIASVQFYVDNNPVGPAITQGVSSTYSYNLDTTLLGNGTHSVKAVATDNLNQQTPATAVSFSVSNVSGGGNGAAFVKTDTTTQGNWKGVYGGAGEIIANDGNSLPGYAVINFTGANLFTWTFTTDPRALLTAASTSNRIASVFYNAPGFSIDVNFTDGNAHTLALYLLDWDGSGRAETVTIVDAANTSSVLDARSAAGFANGTYLVWNITGHVKIQVTGTAGPNAVVSGVFFQ
jgi:hypothetical protein